LKKIIRIQLWTFNKRFRSDRFPFIFGAGAVCLQILTTMWESQKIKVEEFCDEIKQTESDDYIVNNIKQEPEVEFTLFLPPINVKAKKVKNIELKQKKKKKTKNLQCPHCLKSFEQQKAIYQHLQTHESKRKCQICSKYISKRFIATHLKNHNKLNLYNCDHCSAEFVAKGNLARHIWIHRSDKRYNCSKCNQGFNQIQGFKIHLLSHSTNPRPFQCDLCPKNYTRKEKIREHMLRKHSRDLFLRCVKCSFTTNLRALLTEHAATHPIKLFPDQTCEKKFETKQKAQSHEVVQRKLSARLRENVWKSKISQEPHRKGTVRISSAFV
jgi:Zinc finger, C2H2 type